MGWGVLAWMVCGKLFVWSLSWLLEGPNVCQACGKKKCPTVLVWQRGGEMGGHIFLIEYVVPNKHKYALIFGYFWICVYWVGRMANKILIPSSIVNTFFLHTRESKYLPCNFSSIRSVDYAPVIVISPILISSWPVKTRLGLMSIECQKMGTTKVLKTFQSSCKSCSCSRRKTENGNHWGL